MINVTISILPVSPSLSSSTRCIKNAETFLDIDVAHRHPDGIVVLVLLLQLLRSHAPLAGSAHPHLVHDGHPIRKGDVVKVLAERGATVAIGRRRSMPIRREEGKVAAVAMILSPGLLLVTRLLMMLQLGVVASLSQTDRGRRFFTPEKKQFFL